MHVVDVAFVQILVSLDLGPCNLVFQAYLFVSSDISPKEEAALTFFICSPEIDQEI